MYSYIYGNIVDVNDDGVVLDVSGIGYDIKLNKRDLSSLTLGKAVKIYTHLYVREDEMSIYGFLDQNDKYMFLKLIEVRGVGVKSAVLILSTLTTSELLLALNTGDIDEICKCPTIGKKTAQHILLELQGKLVDVDKNISKDISPNVLEAKEALSILGFSDSDIDRVISTIDGISDMSTEEITKISLKRISNA